ncbi:dihydropyrimidinase [Chloroflexota bacterium]
MGDAQRILITNGQVVTGNQVLAADVLIEGERIVGVLALGAVSKADRIIDAAGCYVFPGIVDAHTHIVLDTGLYQTVDTWEVGTRAAAFGGVTTVIDFANQIVGQPLAEALRVRQAEAADATIDYTFHMVLLDHAQDPATLTNSLQELMALGVPSIKLFTTYRPNYYVDDATILDVFRAMPADMIAMIHCENDSMVTAATRRLVEQGKTSWQYHGVARPVEAEAEAANRILYLAALAGARVFVAHNSTGMTTELVNRQRTQAGQWAKVFCETCPQYLLLDDTVYAGDHPEHYILQPPLRPTAHQERLKKCVEAGMVDVLSTDSCDYSLDQKLAELNFTRTPGGLPGIETLLPLMFTLFKDSVGLPRLLQMLAENPARLFGLYPRKGAIQPGSDADLVIYDPSVEATIRHQDLHSLAGYSPFEGMKVQGRVQTVLSRGEVIVDQGEFFGRAGRGEFLPGGPSLDPR